MRATTYDLRIIARGTGQAVKALKASIALVLFSISAIFWCTTLFIACLPALFISNNDRKSAYIARRHPIVDRWVGGNGRILRGLDIVDIEVDGSVGLTRGDWSLVTSNHQTWADIVVLQCALLPHAPVLKFFMKRELIWVPFIGLACWALQFPFMRRYSAAVLDRHPQLRTTDQETTQRACQRFRQAPTAVLNFVEGTRFTTAKHRAQNSPYQHLLRPRAGGFGFVIAALGDKLQCIIDATIIYPGAAPTFWEFLSGHAPRVTVQLQRLAVPTNLLGGDYAKDEQYRGRIRDWIDTLWLDKDQRLIAANDRPADDNARRTDNGMTDVSH